MFHVLGISFLFWFIWSIYIYVQSHYLHVIRINRHYQSICLFVTETNYCNRGVKNFKIWLNFYLIDDLANILVDRNLQARQLIEICNLLALLWQNIFFISICIIPIYEVGFFFVTGSFSLRYNFQRIDLWTEQSLSSHALL